MEVANFQSVIKYQKEGAKLVEDLGFGLGGNNFGVRRRQSFECSHCIRKASL